MAEIRLKSTGTIKLFENDNTSNITIASPASLGADRTITLPDASVTLASGTMLATDGDGSSLTGVGITEADQWRVTADFSGSTNPISANWERVDSKLSGYLGTGMSESSGYWTFPSTGFWIVDAYADLNLTSGTTTWASISIKATEDAAGGATYTGISTTTTSFADGSAANYETVHNIVLLDVTDTANDKFYMGFGTGNASVACKGNTDDSMTGMNFFRLADT